MQMLVVLGVVLGLASVAQAATQTLYFHQSDTPLPVPGGSANFLLDAVAPSTSPPIVEERVIGAGGSADFPTFLSAPFAADATLLPIASVRLNLSANQKMKGCAVVGAELFHVDGTGALASIGSADATNATIVPGKSGGTVGFFPTTLEFPVTSAGVLAGEGVAVVPTLGNQCSISRRLFLAYDGFYAPSRVRFQCCFTTAAKCAAKKLKATAKLATCLLGFEAKNAAKGVPIDPVKLASCSEKFGSEFVKLDGRGGCLVTGDDVVIGPKATDVVADLATALNPNAPLGQSRCQTTKLKAASKATSCLVALEAKAAEKGQFLEPDATKAAKCRTALATAFTKAEAKDTCDTTADAATTQSTIDAFASDVASTLACPCP